MHKSFVRVAGLAVMLMPALALGETSSEVGYSATEIRLGNTAPWSGPASAYSLFAKSEAAVFAAINASGGIHGRKVVFTSLDDGFSPPKTIEQTRKLVERDEVLAMFGSVGTAPNTAVRQYLNARKVPQLLIQSGATKWADPSVYPWTMGFQPSYQTEGRIYAKYILNNFPGAKIAILFQNDDYGKDYLKGFEDELGEGGRSSIVEKISYEITAPTVDSEIVRLKASGATVFFDVTQPKFAAQAIKRMAEIGWRPVHLLNSIANSVGSVLTPAGLENARGIISAQFSKDPTDPRWEHDAEVSSYKQWARDYLPQSDPADPLVVWGYSATKLFIHILDECGDDLSRDNVMRQASHVKNYRPPMLLPSVIVGTGEGDFRLIKSLELQKFDGARWTPIDGGSMEQR